MMHPALPSLAVYQVKAAPFFEWGRFYYCMSIEQQKSPQSAVACGLFVRSAEHGKPGINPRHWSGGAGGCSNTG